MTTEAKLDEILDHVKRLRSELGTMRAEQAERDERTDKALAKEQLPYFRDRGQVDMTGQKK